MLEDQIENLDVDPVMEEDDEDAELGLVSGMGTGFAEGAITGVLVDTLIDDDASQSGWMAKLKLVKSAFLARNWMNTMRPVSVFLGPSQFKKPVGKSEVVSRLQSNLPYFFTNYVLVFIIFLIFTIITSPLLFFSVCIIGYGWYWANGQEMLSLGPVKLEGKTKMITLSVATLIAILLVAGSSIVWVLALTGVMSAGHAIMHTGALPELEGDELEIEPLV